MVWGTEATFAASLAALCALVLLYGLRPLERWRYRAIPGPKPRWLVGNGRTYIDGKRIYSLQAAAKKYGKVFKVWLGGQPTVIVSDAETARLVLLKNPVRSKTGNPGQFTFSSKILKQQTSGLFTTQDKVLHKSLKHAWMPSMNSETLAGNAHLMDSSVAKMMTFLEGPAAAGQEVNVWRLYGDMTLDVVATAAFGVDFHTQKTPGTPGAEQDADTRELVQAVQDIFRYAGNASTIYAQLLKTFPGFKPLLTAISLAFPDTALTKVRRAQAHMDKLVEQLIRDARSKANQGAGVEVHVMAHSRQTAGLATRKSNKAPRGVKPGSFPTMMVTAMDPHTHKPLDDVVAAAQAATFLLAGYETTATTLAFTTYALATNPDKMAKLQQELDGVAKGGRLSLEQIYQLPYLEATFKEALRLFSPVPFTERVTEVEQTLGGFRIPPGTVISVPIFSIQRDACYWPGPEQFIPERWLAGNPEHHPHTPGAWMPFGEGTRICAGQRFALQELKITLARLLSEYSFRLAPGQEDLLKGGLRGAITLSPDTGKVCVVPIRRSK